MEVGITTIGAFGMAAMVLKLLIVMWADSYQNMECLMEHHTNVVCCKEKADIENEIENIEQTNIIIIVPEFDFINNYLEEINVLEASFEVRVMCTMKDTNLVGTKWKSSMFCRHGGRSYMKWWYQERHSNICF